MVPISAGGWATAQPRGEVGERELDLTLWRRHIRANGTLMRMFTNQLPCARAANNNRMWVLNMCKLLQAASFSFILFKALESKCNLYIWSKHFFLATNMFGHSFIPFQD